MTDDARVAYILSDELRLWLRRRPETIPVISTVLVYELAALIAKGADTVEEAEELIDAWTDEMKDQVRRLGVGHEHP